MSGNVPLLISYLLRFPIPEANLPKERKRLIFRSPSMTIQEYWSTEIDTWKVPPTNKKLLKYIDYYWLINRGRGVKTYSHPKLHPDHHPYLIIADENQPYKYRGKNNTYSGRGSHWVFPHTEPFFMDHSNGVTNLGIKFKTGAMYSIPEYTTSWKTNTVQSFSLDNLLGQSINHISDIIKEAKVYPYIYRNLLDHLLSKWLTNFIEDRHSELVREILNCIEHTSISHISEKFHKSQRTIERSFLKVTGLTMKEYQSIQKLERMLVYIYQMKNQQPNWANIATEFDFNDQSHLIRYMKSLINVTPGQYLRDRNLTIDVYGDFKYVP